MMVSVAMRLVLVAVAAGIVRAELLAITPLKATVSEVDLVHVVLTVELPSDAGTFDYTYQWYHDGTLLSGETNRELVLEGVRRQSAGRYWNVLTRSDSLERQSIKAEVVVHYRPSFTLQPVEVTVADPGADVTLAVQVDANPAATFEWRWSGDDGHVTIDNATANTLVITNISAFNKGLYTAVAINSEGLVTSQQSLLQVKGPPAIVEQPVGGAVDPDGTFQLSIRVSGTPFPSVQWQKDGEDLVGETGLSLVVFKASAEDEGSYRAIVENSIGSVTSDIGYVSVNEPPAIVAQLENATGIPGQQLSLTVSASGTPPLIYKWLKQDVGLFSTTSDNTVPLGPLTEDIQGWYSVQVSNSAGTIMSQTVFVNVLDPPVILANPRGLYLYEGDHASLSVDATGDAPLTFTWKRDGIVVANSSGSLLDMDVTVDDAGNYTVLVSNTAGSVISQAATVSVEDLPPNALPPGMELSAVSRHCAQLHGDCELCLNSSANAPGDCAYCQGGTRDGCIAGPRHLATSESICSIGGGLWIGVDSGDDDQCQGIRMNPGVDTKAKQSGGGGGMDMMVVASGAVVAILLVVLAIILVAAIRRRRRSTQRKYAQLRLSRGSMGSGSVNFQTIYQDQLVPFFERSPDHSDLFGSVYKRPNELDPTKVEVKELLGTGAFGEVYSGVLATADVDADGQPRTIDVALKYLKDQPAEEDQEKFLAEACLLGSLEHPNIVGMIGVLMTEPPVMVLELCELGALDVYLRKTTTTHDARMRMAYGIANGMEYLDELGFIHRDLAARNVLYTSDHQCKVADFGLSRRLNEHDTYQCNQGLVALRWTAPEAITQRKFTRKTDVWSFGIVLWEIWSQAALPYGKKWNNVQVIQEIAKGYRLPPPTQTPCPRELYLLMMNCWHPNSDYRPSFGEIKERLLHIPPPADGVHTDEQAQDLQGVYIDIITAAPFTDMSLADMDQTPGGTITDRQARANWVLHDFPQLDTPYSRYGGRTSLGNDSLEDSMMLDRGSPGNTSTQSYAVTDDVLQQAFGRPQTLAGGLDRSNRAPSMKLQRGDRLRQSSTTDHAAENIYDTALNESIQSDEGLQPTQGEAEYHQASPGITSTPTITANEFEECRTPARQASLKLGTPSGDLDL
eukprot:m.64548 g.64548  ORF g.64548 m.64548 type:complete len:1132 (+) comp13600_c0_seq1:218-3613(+)